MSGSNYGANVGGLKKINNHFCTHCIMSGHSVDRCFKLHGYPANFKVSRDRRVVAVSLNTFSGDKSEKSDVNTSITVEQYQQLMDLLNKQYVSHQN